MLKYLQATFESGGDFAPTLDNAAGFTAMAIDGAQLGDPCLVAEDADKIVAFHFALGIEVPYGLTPAKRTIRSWGTYVLPAYRKQRLGVSLVGAAVRLSALRGYDRYTGMMTTGLSLAKAINEHVAPMEDAGMVTQIDLRKYAERTGKAA
jgi:GNAT superfamily N-acetyltransferase